VADQEPALLSPFGPDVSKDIREVTRFYNEYQGNLIEAFKQLQEEGDIRDNNLRRHPRLPPSYRVTGGSGEGPNRDGPQNLSSFFRLLP